MRWIMLLLAVGAFVLVFTTKSPSVLGIALAVGVICSFGFFLGLVASRISANAQPESSMIADPSVAPLRTRTQRLKQIQATVQKQQPLAIEHKLDADRS